MHPAKAMDHHPHLPLPTHHRYLAKNADDESIKETITEYYLQNPTLRMGTVDPATQLFRWRLVESSAVNGIALRKLDGMRYLIERGGESMTDSHHLGQFIPQILLREQTTMRCEIKGEYVTLVYDATSRLGEAIATLARRASNPNPATPV